MRKYIILICFFFNFNHYGYSQNECKKRHLNENYVPKNLNDAVLYLNCQWSEKDKQEFKNKPEKEAVTDLHFGTGRAIRNNWGLWGKGINRLKLYFRIKGITHPDDISSIILTSFHRHLNNKDKNLKNQVQEHKKYWKNAKQKTIEEQKDLRIKLKNEFENYKVGDTVIIAFNIYPPYEKEGLKRVHSVQGYPELNENWNCPVTGVIIDKRIRKRNDYTLKIKLNDICENKEVFWLDIYNELGSFKVDEVYDFFSIKHYKINRK